MARNGELCTWFEKLEFSFCTCHKALYLNKLKIKAVKKFFHERFLFHTWWLFSLATFLYIVHWKTATFSMPCKETQFTKPSTNLDISPKSEPTLELNSRVAPSVEAHHYLDGEGLFWELFMLIYDNLIYLNNWKISSDEIFKLAFRFLTGRWF